MEFFLSYQWEVFIFLEVMSWVFLLLFLIIRYAFSKEKLGRLFLFLFILFIVLEALLAYIIYLQTGEIATFQIVIIIFVIYAFTFGISDFKKLDRYIKSKVGTWRGVDLLTEKDRRTMEQIKEPKRVARKNRNWWYVHTVIIVIAHWFFWINFGNSTYSFLHYVTDLSWFGEESLAGSPFTNEKVMQVSKIWMIIYCIDSLVSLSYTFFPSKE